MGGSLPLRSQYRLLPEEKTKKVGSTEASTRLVGRHAQGMWGRKPYLLSWALSEKRDGSNTPVCGNRSRVVLRAARCARTLFEFHFVPVVESSGRACGHSNRSQQLSRVALFLFQGLQSKSRPALRET